MTNPKICLDKAYHSNEVEQEMIKRGYNSHIRHRREEIIFCRKKHTAKKKMGRRERTNS